MSNQPDTARRLVRERFDLLGRLGAGAAGTVFAARDRSQGRTVALKRLRDPDPRGVYYFKQEFRAIADISHPNLVSLYELFVDGEDFFLSMELVQGEPISEYLRPPSSKAIAVLAAAQSELPEATTGQRPAISQVVEAHDARGADGRAARASRLAATASPTVLDWDRIRRTFTQLADALLALHQAGVLHRDLKPSNVLVTNTGRVVVLDFGLVGKIDPIERSYQHSLVGTPAYMAPEICLGRRYEEASDWFSFGTMLFEVLTGQLPHRADSFAELIGLKARGVPINVASLNPAVPGDLAELCAELLQGEPAARPSGSSVRARLGHTESAMEVTQPGARLFNRLLIGREVELTALRDAFESSRRAAVLVRVHGVSGMGKSTLLETFLRRIESDEGALVFRGRCYQQEFLPYKTIDGVVDELSEYLARLAPAEAQRLLPDHMQDLAKVFAVVAQVPSIGTRSSTEFQEDPIAVKRSAFGALRELLVRIARERPLVVFIDDVHWGDLESVDILEELLQPPDAPSLLLIVAFRSEELESSPFLRMLGTHLGASSLYLDVRDIAVPPLSPATSEELAQILLADSSRAGSELVHRIAAESEGHPLLIEELVRHALSPDHWVPAPQLSASGGLLTHVLCRRIGELPPRLRTLLDVISLAGAPIPADASCRAAGMSGVDQAAIQHLLVRRLVRAHRESNRDEIVPYHDRIRETVVDALTPGDRRQLHRALGNALLCQEGVPPRVLVTHFEEAGEFSIAAKHAVAAAEQAEQALAFKEAAALYRKVLTWSPGKPDDARRFRTRYADALFNQGLCREAAAAYAEAAYDAPADESVALQTRAALSFMTCGAVEEGAPFMRTVLREVGVGNPRAHSSVVLHLMGGVALLRLRGLRYRRRADHEIGRELLRRVDTSYAAAHAYILHDFVRSATFLVGGLRRALAAGEPGRLIEGAALIGGFLASFRWKFGERLITTAVRLADELGTPFARGISHLGSALKCFMHDDWKTGLAHADEACDLLSRCADVTTVQQFAQIQRLLMLRSLERFDDIEQSSDRNRRWAREVGNPYLEAAANLESVLPLLARDALDSARARLSEALKRASPRDGYIIHSALTLRVKCDLYEGRWRQAHDHVEEQWDALRRGGMLMVPTAWEFYGGLRAGVALEVAARDRDARQAARRVARKGLKRLRRTRSDFGRGCLAALRAAVASDDERIDDAVTLCREAANHFADASLPVRAAALERRAAELQGSRAGIAKADAELSVHGIVDPVRWTRSVAPGFRTAARV